MKLSKVSDGRVVLSKPDAREATSDSDLEQAVQLTPVAAKRYCHCIVPEELLPL